MRLLLDESVPMQLRSLLVGHDVSTVRQMGWRAARAMANSWHWPEMNSTPSSRSTGIWNINISKYGQTQEPIPTRPDNSG